MARQSHSMGSRLGNRRGAHGSGGNFSLQKMLVFFVGAIAASCIALAVFLVNNAASGSTSSGVRAARHKDMPIPSLDNPHNAFAMDIYKSLSCDSLAEEEAGKSEAKATARRLADVDPGEDADKDWVMGEADDFADPLYSTSKEVNGKHLMCLVAGAAKLPSHVTKDAIKCDALGTRQEALLDVWASARSQMPLEVIQAALGAAVEKDKVVVRNPLHIWAPWNDDSVDYQLTGLNDEGSGISSLSSVLGAKSLFVDIGSGLGLSSLAARLLYPKTTVLSVEPAGPSWLLSRINIVCNLDPGSSKLPNVVLAGVGRKNNVMGKMMWRPSSAGTTRAWSPKAERRDDDVELIVRLRTLRSILAEAAADEDLETDPPVSVALNVDCEGCEYNMIPSLSEGEFDAIDTIIGTTGVHWGYIPADKLPSSERGKQTHERLCGHYDFPRQCIECCAFPNLKVKRPGTSELQTVSAVAGDLCSSFKNWAVEKNLFDSTDDYGWTELSSMSDI